MDLTAHAKSVIESLTCPVHQKHPIVTVSSDQIDMRCCCRDFKKGYDPDHRLENTAFTLRQLKQVMESRSSGVNRVYLFGMIKGEPVSETRHGKRYRLIFLATLEIVGRDSKARTVEETHRVLADENLDLKEGDQLFIQGKIQTRNFVDDTGIKRYQTEIFALTTQLF